MEYFTTVKITENSVILGKGTMSVFTDGTCVTNEKGNAFWTTHPDTACNNVLYGGLATKLTAMRQT